MRRDTMNTRTKQEADATQAALLLGQERYAEAIPYLQRAARSAKGDFKQARLYYLLGQIYHQQNQPKEAYKALQKCLKKVRPLNWHSMHAFCKPKQWQGSVAWATK